MRIIQQIAEEKIQEAMANGEFADLPEKGQPYQLDGYLFEKLEQRIARKLLKDHNFQPVPLALRKKIERQLEKIEKAIELYRQRYAWHLSLVARAGGLVLAYPPERYWEHPAAHQRFVQKYLPIWRQIKTSTRFIQAVKSWQQFQKIAVASLLQEVQVLLDLQEEYEDEIIKLCIQERDFFRLETGVAFKQFQWWEQYLIQLFPPIEEAIP